MSDFDKPDEWDIKWLKVLGSLIWVVRGFATTISSRLSAPVPLSIPSPPPIIVKETSKLDVLELLLSIQFDIIAYKKKVWEFWDDISTFSETVAQRIDIGWFTSIDLIQILNRFKLTSEFAYGDDFSIWKIWWNHEGITAKLIELKSLLFQGTGWLTDLKLLNDISDRSTSYKLRQIFDLLTKTKAIPITFDENSKDFYDSILILLNWIKFYEEWLNEIIEHCKKWLESWF